ncbi:MAG: CBS domain-containing protein, partial [Gammaproteobacteria bacterium]|nr:CBS domain-containing protein [Gammaproteobacteria bacterium]
MPTDHAKAVYALHRELLERYPAEAARLLEKSPVREIAKVLEAQPLKFTIPVWERLAPDIGTRVFKMIKEPRAVAVLNRMDPNRGAALLAGCDKEDREHYIMLVSPNTARDLRMVMSYPVDSAGALMDPRVFLFRADMTVREVLSRLRSSKRRGVRVVFVVDANNHLEGMVPVQDLALAKHATRLHEIMLAVPESVDAIASREETVDKFDRYRLTDLPVVDFEGRLLGVVLYHTLVSAAEDELAAKMQTMVGVSRDERALSKASFAVRKRLPWLQINLATAFLAASVVGLFESTIAKYTALAVLLPVVAGQSGNTGAQALAVTMRGLALREIRSSHWPRVVFKEINVGFWNGIAVALVTSAGVFVWSRSAG